MRLSTPLLAALVAVAAAATLPITLSAGDADTESRVAPPAADQERGTERPRADRPPERWPELRWRRSVAVGSPTAGRLIRGVHLPARGAGFATWDPNLRRSPN